MSELLRVERLVRDYRLPRTRLFAPAPQLRALHGISLQLAAGESLGVVGESGCGKSTLARAVVALEPPTAGAVYFRGEALASLSPQRLRECRREIQMVFQDPYGSLDPRHRVGRSVAEPLDVLEPKLARDERHARIAEALHEVGLRVADADKFPHQFSGGQRQRIAIARALITRPTLIVADEPVSALDVSVQSQVLNLLLDLREQLGLTYLFISHDLGVVRHVTDRVVVMQSGRIVEHGPTQQVLEQPQHPYTRTLLAALPRPGVRWR